MPRVLLAEDEPHIRFLVSTILRQRGYEVIEAEDGQEAVAQIVEDGPFDLIITDIRMPHTDGVTVTTTAKERDPDIPILVISAYSADIEQALAHGADSFLPKPFTHTSLVTTIEELRRSVDGKSEAH